ncbi:MAG: SAM-dependent methyltransferase [Streptosporangiaceae bacterium]
MAQTPHAPAGIDVTRPAPARIYDYMLRGDNHFESDVQAAERILSVVPEIRDCAWSNRGFHQRAAKWIAEQGVSQFIDIGSGLPTVGNTHEVVQKVIPGARVVYVDNDPMVAEQGGRLLANDKSTRVICADLREPDSILNHPDVRELIDFSRPAGLLFTAVIMFVSDPSDPWNLVTQYVDAIAPGSYLALSHLTDDYKPPVTTERFRAVFDHATEQLHFRSREGIARFFTGLDMVPPYDGAKPAICYTGVWGAEDPVLADSDGARWLYCGVARKP